jgi:RNA polymerase sigma-70 factor (ECF subfamily)
MSTNVADPQSTRKLFERSVEGDRQAFGELMGRFSDRLLRLVRTRIGPGLRGNIEPDDVLQETFRRALEGLPRCRWAGEEDFLKWLGSIAEHWIRDAARKLERRARTERFLEIRCASPSGSPSRKLRREERFERLEKALAGLPPEYRDVIRLSRIDGLKIREIAQRMGRSEDAVKQLIVRALRRLKAAFGNTESLHLPDRSLEGGGS